MAKLLVLLLNISLIPLVFGQCNVETATPYLKRAVYEFSTELVARLAEDTENHFVTSPVSPWTLISTISLGATGETLNEIKKVIRLHPHRCFNKKFFEIIKDVVASEDGTVLERSSTFFVDNRMPLKEIFKERVRKTEVCSIEAISFDNVANTATIINDYVSKATRGKIDNIVEANDLVEVYVVIVDALFFVGSWKTGFSPADTETSAFYDENGAQIGDVSLMFGQIEASMARISLIEAKVLELPYVNERFSMFFFLPDTDVSIMKVIENMKHISLKTIIVQLTDTQQVSVQIPKFKISSDLDNLKELLIDMGLRTMFDQRDAKLTDISDYQLYVSNFIQKADIEVTEEGTKAGAATAVFLEGRSLHVHEFTANKPFLFMIVDKVTEIPLFTGAYSKPSIYTG